ncbi:MAG: glycosyltransferase family 9 protein [Elusimicrobiales bacterium]|nr:glycosyltransferase family 9 protein [Elusimicrobiales bacterium]MCK5106424.1 glycosyltransferase family 9 protein [Elusimicrobiales bacterium]MCK5584155.1 glycosyltransferase family 9 protein [Elusimicrobiales bacterium]
MEINNKNFENILLILIGRVGDYVITTPFIKTLRTKYPKAKITLLVSTKAKQLALRNKDLDEVIIFENWTNILSNFKLLFLGSNKYDIAIDLNPAYSRTSIGIMRLTRSPMRLTFTKKAPENAYTHFIENATMADEHFADKYSRMANFLNAEYIREMNIDVSDEDSRVAQKLIANLNMHPDKPLIAIHPGNFKKTGHRWPEEKFVSFTRHLLKHTDANLFYLIGLGEEIVTKKNILDALPGVKSINPVPLGPTAAILKKADLLICNSTGTLHISAAVGTPTFSFNTEYSLKCWKPEGEKHFHASGSWKSCQVITVETALERFNEAFDYIMKLRQNKV